MRDKDLFKNSWQVKFGYKKLLKVSRESGPTFISSFPVQIYWSILSASSWIAGTFINQTDQIFFYCQFHQSHFTCYILPKWCTLLLNSSTIWDTSDSIPWTGTFTTTWIFSWCFTIIGGPLLTKRLMLDQCQFLLVRYQCLFVLNSQ